MGDTFSFQGRKAGVLGLTRLHVVVGGADELRKELSDISCNTVCWSCFGVCGTDLHDVFSDLSARVCELITK